MWRLFSMLTLTLNNKIGAKYNSYYYQLSCIMYIIRNIYLVQKKTALLRRVTQQYWPWSSSMIQFLLSFILIWFLFARFLQGTPDRMELHDIVNFILYVYCILFFAMFCRLELCCCFFCLFLSIFYTLIFFTSGI